MPVPHHATLDTPRLHLRPLQEADLADLWALNADPEVTRFLPHGPWHTPADAQAWWARSQARTATGEAWHWALVSRESGRVIGHILLFRFDADSARAELGYALAQAHWGQGWVREAVQAVLSAAFGSWGLRRIEAEVNPLNQPSSQLLLRLGFAREGLLRQRWVFQGQPYDTHIYGLLASDWAAPSAV